jgi:hypothetical protein
MNEIIPPVKAAKSETLFRYPPFLVRQELLLTVRVGVRRRAPDTTTESS